MDIYCFKLLKLFIFSAYEIRIILREGGGGGGSNLNILTAKHIPTKINRVIFYA